MTGLGNVFEPLEAEEGPRGPDLRVSVEVPRAALGGSLRVQIPARLAAGDDLVARAQTPGEPEDRVLLHLPESLPAGAVLRLRGQGGEHPEGRPGDLFVAIELVDRPLRAEERVVGALHRGASANVAELVVSTALTWWILLGLALVAAAILAVMFA